MQQHGFCSAESVYRKAQVLQPDDNNTCNLSVCLMKQGKMEEAMGFLQCVLNNNKKSTNYNHTNCRGISKSLDRVEALLKEIRDSKTEERAGVECQSAKAASSVEDLEWVWCSEDGVSEEGCVMSLEVNRKRNRLRVFQEITSIVNKNCHLNGSNIQPAMQH